MRGTTPGGVEEEGEKDRRENQGCPCHWGKRRKGAAGPGGEQKVIGWDSIETKGGH